MTATYDPETTKRLIAETREDRPTAQEIDKALTIISDAAKRDLRDRKPPDMQFAWHVINDLSRTRNLRAIAVQLEAAQAEVDRLSAGSMPMPIGRAPTGNLVEMVRKIGVTTSRQKMPVMLDSSPDLIALLLEACNLGEPAGGVDDPRWKAPHTVQSIPMFTGGDVDALKERWRRIREVAELAAPASTTRTGGWS